MKKVSTVYFEEGGPKNSQATLGAVLDRAKDIKPEAIIVATSSGQTAALAGKVFKGTGLRVVAVPFQKHLWERFAPVNPTHKAEAQLAGVVFIPDEPHVRFIDSDYQEMANAFRIVSQGFKVAIQVATMAVDTGVVKDGAKVIAVGGSHQGADTAIVLTARDYEHIFGTKVHEIIAMPSQPLQGKV